MSSINLLDKLERVERTVNVYKIDGDDELIEEISVDCISLDVLRSIIHPPNEDPLLYDGYSLNDTQLLALNTHLVSKIIIDMDKFQYILVCGGIYNW